MLGPVEVEGFVCVEHPTDLDAPARTPATRKRTRSDSDAECGSDVDGGQFTTAYLSKKFAHAVDEVQVQYMPFLDESQEDDVTFAKLWALYQQVRVGNAPSEEDTSAPDDKKRLYAEWRTLEGLSREECMRRYISIAKTVTTLDFTTLKFDLAQEKVALYYLPFVGEEGDKDLYTLFGLFKQATDGDVPDGTQPEDDTDEAKQKLAAWTTEKGRGALECMKDYIRLTDTVIRSTAQRQRI